ncbi:MULTISPECIES: hypothetical protein [Halomonas]|uniref:Calcineurin-like phosphoesterase family protein n=1 Tax=Halomonas ventosae TaxID=229007 RepID=A0A4R6I3C8_9GAMM|nr:hypothetical protein [Halomonas ventosae]TDO16490.1 hypothetical protein DFO68_10116 [Halomonas ventosae]
MATNYCPDPGARPPGDIHAGLQRLGWAAERFAGTPILYVPGNHEFYGTAMPELRRELAAEAARLGIHLLDNGRVVISHHAPLAECLPGRYRAEALPSSATTSKA